MNSTARTLAIMAFTALVGCTSQINPATPSPPDAVVLAIHHTATTAPLINALTTAYQDTHPNIDFDTQSGNHQRQMTQLENGNMPYFVSPHLPADNRLWAAPIAREGIAIIVNEANPLNNLTTEQIRRVYQGNVRNWAALGGEDLPITAYSREAGSGLRIEFEAAIMGQRRTTPNAQIVPSARAALQRITENRGGIAYIPLSQYDGRGKILTVNGIQPQASTIAAQTYPLRSLIYLIGLAEPADHYRAFVGWVQSEAGQARVRGAVFVPLS